MKLINIDDVEGTFVSEKRYTGAEVMALLNQQVAVYNINNVFEELKEKIEKDTKHTFDGCINKRYVKQLIQELKKDKNIHLCGITNELTEPEYTCAPINWNKLPVNTAILVRNSKDEPWEKRHFAKYENNTIYAYDDGKTSWSIDYDDCIMDWKFAKLAKSDNLF